MNIPREPGREYLADWGFSSSESASSVGGAIGNCTKDLRNLKSANPVSDAQQVLNIIRATQERERKEAEEQIAKEVRHLDDSKASYHNLTEGLQQSEIVTRITEGVISSA